MIAFSMFNSFYKFGFNMAKWATKLPKWALKILKLATFCSICVTKNWGLNTITIFFGVFTPIISDELFLVDVIAQCENMLQGVSKRS